jgi:hypothetical protein
MKTIICLVAIVLLSITLHAQGKHSIAVGADWLDYSKPKAWRNNNSLKFLHNIGNDVAFLGAYYYKNQISVRFYYTMFQQDAYYKEVWQTPESYLYQREATFYDFTLGYNFSKFIKKRLPSKMWDKTGIWLYAGLSKLGEFSDKSRQGWTPLGGWDNQGEYYGTGTTWYSGKWKPTAQFMVKYNPIRFVFLGVGGTYHHVDKEFKPVSFNVSAGLQL